MELNPQHTIVDTREGYDRWAEVYDDEDNPLIILEHEQVMRLVGNARGCALADVGCGTGRHAFALAKSGATVTGIDFSPGMLDQARRKHGAGDIQFIEHDLTQPLPLAGDSFDIVLCCLVLEHIQDLDLVFAEMMRICKRDGIAVISEMHPAMRLKGVQARFIDPESGQRIGPRAANHFVSDYVMAAMRAGWQIDHMSEHIVHEALAEQSPRGAKYLSWPMLLMMRLTKSGGPLHQ